MMIGLLTIVLSLLLADGLLADSLDGIAFFERKIRPVLADKCYPCHAADAKKIKGGLLLDTRDGIRTGGDSGPAVVPGNQIDSLLLTAIRYTNRGMEMPPDEKLSDSVIEDFAHWIKIGAPDSREGSSVSIETGVDMEEGRKHWAFQPISNPPVPAIKDTTWPRTDIDRFVLAALEEKGLKPVDDAAPVVLRRRIAFDLTGLPPNEASTTDPQSQIRSLLASPRFGERWGRHWLDVARYAESTGGGHNVLLPLAFRYRDWVIDALNADKPYDQFIREQVAGDLLPARNDEQRNSQLIATGFLGVGLKDLREQELTRFRMAMADEMIDATSRAFLGLTIACAKCHDHKFDPIPTRDYYALAGIFASSEPLIGVRRNRKVDPFAASVKPLAGTHIAMADTDAAELLKERVALTYLRLKVRNAKYAVLGKGRIDANPESEQAKILAENPTVRAAEEAAATQSVKVDRLLKRYNDALPFSAMAVRDVLPNDVPIHIRGEDSQLGEMVPRGFLQVLTLADTKPVNRSQSGRLELADWIASPNNPLTARVMVNRVWQHLFGVGLVESSDDFGKTGQPPSNVALLDYLAQRFIANDWRIKKLIEEIMSSRVYQLSTAHDAKAYEFDPANRFHWRMNRRRLDSDAIRDAIQYISGDLILTRPEPQIALAPQDDDRVKSMDIQAWLAPTANHRTIYHPVLRDHIPDDWSVFDFPDPALVTGRRGVTTVPTQALYLMNSPFIASKSEKTATRIAASEKDPVKFICEAYSLILNRAPTSDELRDASEMQKSFAATSASPIAAASALCQTLFASAEFRYLY